MKIDLHCHTKKIKSGDAKTRNVTKKLFTEKIMQAGVKIVAITNHNHFDLEQYLELKNSVEGYCDIWPGVELDIECKGKMKSGNKRGHLIVISNPKYTELFDEKVREIIGSIDVNVFLVDLKRVYDIFQNCDCIYIPHFHKEPGFSEEDIEELNALLPDKSRLFKETSDYRSLGVFSNFDYSVIIGSDVQDWETYEQCKFADIRLPLQTYEQFCLLAQKDIQIIDTLLNKKKKKEIKVSPCEGVYLKLPFYEDVNIIFGQKGTGKSEILSSLKKQYIEQGISVAYYIGNEKESEFSKLLKTSDVVVSAEKLGIKEIGQSLNSLYEWQDVIPTVLSKYVRWYETKDNNRNKGTMKITDCVHIEEESRDRRLETDYKYTKEFTVSNFQKINFKRYLTEQEYEHLQTIISLLCDRIDLERQERWIKDKSTKLTNWSIDKIKSIADKCSDTVSKPSSTGFYEFAKARFNLFEIIDEVMNAFEMTDCVEKEYIGNLEEKGDIYIQTRFRILKKESRREEFSIGIKILRACKQVFERIKKEVFTDSISELLNEYQEYYDEGIKTIEAFIGVSKETILENGDLYKPSNGERGILLMQRMLDAEDDVYILDEPELGMGNSYITNNILPKIINLAKQRKTVIIATHNANIAVGSLPYVSVLRTHENGIYKTYVGNPFCDQLTNIDEEDDIRNWTIESMHTLEGGRDAFYGRKDIYESGRK